MPRTPTSLAPLTLRARVVCLLVPLGCGRLERNAVSTLAGDWLHGEPAFVRARYARLQSARRSRGRAGWLVPQYDVHRRDVSDHGGGPAAARHRHGLQLLPRAAAADPPRETWRATFNDYVTCNCKVVRDIHWARDVPWIPDPATPATFDPNRGKRGPPRYVNVKIVPPSDPDLTRAKVQLKADAYTIPWLGSNDQ